MAGSLVGSRECRAFLLPSDALPEWKAASALTGRCKPRKRSVDGGCRGFLPRAPVYQQEPVQRRFVGIEDDSYSISAERRDDAWRLG